MSHLRFRFYRVAKCGRADLALETHYPVAGNQDEVINTVVERTANIWDEVRICAYVASDQVLVGVYTESDSPEFQPVQTIKY